MTYIIENANILKNKNLTKSSILVDGGRILSIKPSFKRYKYIRMNAESFIMAPTPILFKSNFPVDKPFHEVRNFFIHEFILKGCTTFLTVTKVKYEYELLTAIKKLKTQLLNSPIDYIIGVQIPIRLLTQSFLRKCKKEKIPAVFVEIEQLDELFDLPWGWLREAIFPYNSHLIPLFLQENKQNILMWNKIMKEAKMPFVREEILDDHPVPHSVLIQLGAYPLKASIYQGCELSYNLYVKTREIRKIEESQLFYYHRDKLIITVQNGEVIRSGQDVVFRPGYGKHVTIKTTSHFKMDV